MPKKTECNAEGAFVFDDVSIGPIEIVAWKDGYAYGGLDARVAGDAFVTIALGGPDVISVRAIERRLDPRTAESTPPTPIAGVSVLSLFVDDTFHVSVEDLAPLGFPNPRSNDAGDLTIANLPTGSYVSFTIAHREYAEQRVPSYPAGGKPLTLPMRKGIALDGRVTNDAKDGVALARVSIMRSGPPPLKEYKETRADADGFYRALVEPGDYFVVARQRGYASATPTRVSVRDDREGATCDVTLAAGHRVSGRVTGKDDTPVGGVTVQYIADDTVYDESLTGADGAFQLTAGAGAGKVHVVAPEGYIAGKGTDIEIKVLNQDIALSDAIRVTELPEIAGLIVDRSGAPQADVIVSSIDLDPPAWAVSGADGRFALRLDEAPRGGSATFRAEHTRRFTRKDFTVSFTDLAPQTVTLEDFEPNLAPCDPAQGMNKFDGFRNEKAPAIDCKQWFNLAPEGGAAPKLTLDGLKGSVVVLIFWGGFDTTPKGLTRLSQMNTLFEAFRGADDVKFVGIHDSGSEPKEVTEYIDAYNVAYPVGIDNETATFDLYDIFAIPQIVLIDKKGVFRYYDVEGRLLELIKSLRREAG
ncbi:MAG: redoxin domain-containing protein [Candidatus Hydrogenedentes bacterium]|nr:redoxin domain-containing protein [Candidatus Hydrogenedentota bacterium]